MEYGVHWLHHGLRAGESRTGFELCPRRDALRGPSVVGQDCRCCVEPTCLVLVPRS